MLAFVVVVVGEDEDEGRESVRARTVAGDEGSSGIGKRGDEDSTGKQKISAIGGVAPISR